MSHLSLDNVAVIASAEIFPTHQISEFERESLCYHSKMLCKTSTDQNAIQPEDAYTLQLNAIYQHSYAMSAACLIPLFIPL